MVRGKAQFGGLFTNIARKACSSADRRYKYDSLVKSEETVETAAETTGKGGTARPHSARD